MNTQYSPFFPCNSNSLGYGILWLSGIGNEVVANQWTHVAVVFDGVEGPSNPNFTPDNVTIFVQPCLFCLQTPITMKTKVGGTNRCGYGSSITGSRGGPGALLSI